MISSENLILDGKITFSNANSTLKQMLGYDYVWEEERVIDTSSISHCDSAGISVLLEVKKVLSEGGVEVFFTKPQKQILDLAMFLKVDGILFK